MKYKPVEREIKIRLKFGSPFQEEFATKMLMGYLEIYKDFVESKHKKNKIMIISPELQDLIDAFG